MDSNRTIEYSREGHLGSLTLDSPPTNVIDHAWLDALESGLDAAESDAAARVVVIRSAQPAFFCGGADVDLLRDGSDRDNLAFVRAVQASFTRLERFPKLTVAAIEGHATGGGYELALACDIRIAVTGEYRLGLPEGILGLLPAGGGTQRLSRLIGPHRALALMCTGGLVTPGEGERLGMVDRLVDRDDLASELGVVADRASTVSAAASAAIKRCVRHGVDGSLASGLEVEVREIRTLFDDEDTRHRLAAFDNSSRRPPRPESPAPADLSTDEGNIP